MSACGAAGERLSELRIWKRSRRIGRIAHAAAFASEGRAVIYDRDGAIIVSD